jgi:hypothetical protein
MAYSFVAASSQYLSVLNAPATGVPLTIACRFNATAVGTNLALVQLSNSTGADRFLLSIAATNTPLRAFVQSGGATTAESDYNGVTATTDNHGAAVFAASNSRTAYLNGLAATTNTQTVNVGAVDRFGVGARLFSSTWGLFYGGTIWELGIWDVALTGPEIASLSKGFKCPRVRPQNLKFYAPLIRNLVDLRGGVTITNNNTATVAVQPRVI